MLVFLALLAWGCKPADMTVGQWLVSGNRMEAMKPKGDPPGALTQADFQPGANPWVYPGSRPVEVPQGGMDPLDPERQILATLTTTDSFKKVKAYYDGITPSWEKGKTMRIGPLRSTSYEAIYGKGDRRTISLLSVGQGEVAITFSRTHGD